VNCLQEASSRRADQVRAPWQGPRPWRDIFRINPAARAALNRVIAGLAERLEAGAVLTRAEHELYQGRGCAPASTVFDGKPIRR
jgi:hypothetical protein